MGTHILNTSNAEEFIMFLCLAPYLELQGLRLTQENKLFLLLRNVLCYCIIACRHYTVQVCAPYFKIYLCFV